MIEEAWEKLKTGDLATAEGLASMAAEKAKGLLELATSEAQKQPEAQQQSAPQPGATLSIERVATILTIGGAITGVGGWALKTRGDRRKRAILFSELMQAAADANDRHQGDATQCEAELQKIKDRAINEYKKNLITEKDYHTLNEKIKEYTNKLSEPTREQ